MEAGGKKVSQSFLLSSNRCFTSPHGAVAEGAVGAALRVVRWGVRVLLLTSRSLGRVVMGGRRGDHGDVARPDLIQHQRACEGKKPPLKISQTAQI